MPQNVQLRDDSDPVKCSDTFLFKRLFMPPVFTPHVQFIHQNTGIFLYFHSVWLPLLKDFRFSVKSERRGHAPKLSFTSILELKVNVSLNVSFILRKTLFTLKKLNVWLLECFETRSPRFVLICIFHTVRRAA